MDAYEHNSRQKAKARKSGPSFLEKSNLLGVKAHTFSAAVYWEPTHCEYRIAVYVPEGWSVPDLNGMIADTISGRISSHLPHASSQARSARRQALRDGRPRALSGSGPIDARPVQSLRPVRRRSRQRQPRRTGEQSSSDTDASVDTGPQATDGEASGGSISSLQGSGTDTARPTWGEGPAAGPCQEPHTVAWLGAGNPTGGRRNGAGATQQGEWQETGAWSHVSEPIHGDAMLVDGQADLPQPVLVDGYLETLSHVVSPFDTASWMDFDFLGDLAHETSVGGGDSSEAREGVVEPVSPPARDATNGRGNSPLLPEPSASMMAWRALAKDCLALMDRVLAAGSHGANPGPLVPQTT